MMGNYLYFTNDVEAVRKMAKQQAKKDGKEFLEFKNSKESIFNIINIYNTTNNTVIFLEGLNKSPISNKLLKTLEDNKKDIDIYVTSCTYDVGKPLLARFMILTLNDVDMSKEVNEFIKTRKAAKEVYSSLSFYQQLALQSINNHRNILLINTIVQEILRCTYNTPWDYYFYVLRNNYV